MIGLLEMIEALLLLGGRLFGMAMKAVSLVRKVQAEGREPSVEELDEVRRMDDEARRELVNAIGGK
jgi:hypothetical protein